MTVVFNSQVNFEVAITDIAAATLSGVALTVAASGNLVLATAAAASSTIDAILISEIVTLTTYKDRYYIYTTIDYGPYVQVGEMISVAKGVAGITVNGLSLVSPAAALAKGSLLEIGAGGQFQLKAAGAAVGRCLEACALNATLSNAVQLYR